VTAIHAAILWALFIGLMMLSAARDNVVGLCASFVGAVLCKLLSDGLYRR
jgi:hypothetical protein